MFVVYFFRKESSEKDEIGVWMTFRTGAADVRHCPVNSPKSISKLENSNLVSIDSTIIRLLHPDYGNYVPFRNQPDIVDLCKEPVFFSTYVITM